MTQLTKYNRPALDSYLRGEHGELMRRIAEQELWERGHSVSLADFDNEELAQRLRDQGWICFRRRGTRQ